MNRKQLKIILIKNAIYAITKQNEDGSFLQGKNGPWNSDDTPIRVTAHWSILLLYVFKLTNEEKYRYSALKGINYIINSNSTLKGSFKCINSNNQFLAVNGLIGQAWILELFYWSYEILRDKKFIDISLKLISMFEFDKKYNLWNVLNTKGQSIRIHNTLNQQIWFSVMAYKISILSNNVIIRNQSLNFFNDINSFFLNHKLIHMHINEKIYLRKNKLGSFLKHYYNNIFNHDFQMSKGYLAFSLFGLSLFYKDLKIESFNKKYFKKTILKSIKYLDSYILEDFKNKFSYQYNPVGIEVPFVKIVFKSLVDTSVKNIDLWLNNQFNQYSNNYIMNINSTDSNTLSSRIYELIYLHDISKDNKFYDK